MTSRNNICEDNIFGGIYEHQINHEECLSLEAQQLYGKNADPTGDSCLNFASDFFINSTMNIGDRDYQISFQQKFMDEHIQAFVHQTENFIESSIKFTQDKIKNFKSQLIFSQKLEYQPFTNLASILIDFSEKLQAKYILQKQQKLIQFFKFLYDFCPNKVANELVYLSVYAYQSWKNAIQSKQIQQSQNNISKFSKKLVSDQLEKLFHNERITFINFRSGQKQIFNSQIQLRKAFKQYLVFLFTTTILIAEGYFINPYTQCIKAKRTRGYKLQSQLEQNDQNSSPSVESIELGFVKKRWH